MSSVLEKKLSNETPVSENIVALAPAWAQSLQLLSRLFERKTGVAVERTDFTLSTIDRQSFNTTSAPTQLFYATTSDTTDDALVIRLSPDITALLATKLLDDDEDATLQEPGLLDLCLLEPFAIEVIKILDDTLRTFDRNHLLSPLYPGKKGLNLTETGFMEEDLIEINLMLQCQNNEKNYAIAIACPKVALNEIGLQIKENMTGPLIDIQNTWFPRILKTVQHMPLEVSVLLESLDLSIAECSRLTMGQVIELPGTGIDNLSINVNMGQSLQKIGSGKLGVAKSQKAILLHDKIDDSFLQAIGDFPDT